MTIGTIIIKDTTTLDLHLVSNINKIYGQIANITIIIKSINTLIMEHQDSKTTSIETQGIIIINQDSSIIEIITNTIIIIMMYSIIVTNIIVINHQIMTRDLIITM